MLLCCLLLTGDLEFLVVADRVKSSTRSCGGFAFDDAGSAQLLADAVANTATPLESPCSRLICVLGDSTFSLTFGRAPSGCGADVFVDLLIAAGLPGGIVFRNSTSSSTASVGACRCNGIAEFSVEAGVVPITAGNEIGVGCGVVEFGNVIGSANVGGGTPCGIDGNLTGVDTINGVGGASI